MVSITNQAHMTFEKFRRHEELMKWRDYIQKWCDADYRNEYIRNMNKKNLGNHHLYILMNLTIQDFQLKAGRKLTKRLIKLDIH